MPTVQRVNLRNLIINLLLAAGVVLLLVFILTRFLSWYTHHGESLTVPDFTKLSVAEVEELSRQKDLSFVISDTTYTPDKPKMSIVDQNPKAGSKVKRGRKIYLTINTSKAPKVTIPSELFEDIQYSQAVRILENYGFKVGTVRRVPGIAENVVKAVHLNGNTITPGMKLDKGSTLDLDLEDGGNSAKFPMPSLIGMPYMEAVIMVKGNNLVPGEIIPDKPGTTDYKSTVVYKQNPVPGSNISQGEAVDLWVKDTLK